MIRPLASPSLLLRLEGAVLFVGATALYGFLGGSWLWFAVFLLAPDLAMLGYLVNVSVGAAVYNLFHLTLLPAVLIALGVWGHQPAATLAGLIWLAHIGADRLLGFGLKYPTEFKDTHLGHV